MLLAAKSSSPYLRAEGVALKCEKIIHHCLVIFFF